jgi:nucleoside-diphosphate-sugar epimerase
MKILIIGGGGYIGSVLSQYYLSKDHEVIVLDSLLRGSDGILPFKQNPKYIFLNADFTSALLPLILKTYSPEVIIHLAGIVGDPNCAKDPELATKTNVTGVKWLVECCNSQVSVEKLFFASTCSIYGFNEETCTEVTKPNPLSHYARTKLKAEEIIRKDSKQGISFRFGTAYGWSPNMRYDIVVNLLTNMAIKKKEFNIYDGKQYRPFVHPLDIAIFFESLFYKDLSLYRGEVFNLVSENLSMLDLGLLIERVLPYTLMKQLPDKEDDRSYICRCFKAHSELGFSPKMRVRDGIQEIESNLIKLKEIALNHIAISY